MGGSIHIIETATGRIEIAVNHPGGRIISLAVAPDGRTLATSGWGRPIRRNLPDGQVQSTTPNHHPVCLVELATGKLVRELEMPTSSAGPVAFSADGKLLADRLRPGRRRGAPAGRWRRGRPSPCWRISAPTPHAMAFSADGKSLITGLNDGTALVWDLARVLAPRARKEER